MHHDNDLGDFLRAKRAVIGPEDVGLAPGVDRRVEGLRREEVALLAGVSTDYYRRLEQGRERHPSEQVVFAIARALRLDVHEAKHLCEIALPASIPVADQSPTCLSRGLRILLEHSLGTPASVVGPALDVLGTNEMGAALYRPFARMDNIARMVFLDPVARTFYRDWEKVARSAVANLRAATTSFPLEQRVAEVVGELSVSSSIFASLWAAHEVRPRVEEEKRFHHPEVGDLELHFEALWVSGGFGQRVYVYSAAPDSASADALKLLGRLSRPTDSSRPCEQEAEPRAWVSAAPHGLDITGDRGAL